MASQSRAVLSRPAASIHLPLQAVTPVIMLLVFAVSIWFAAASILTPPALVPSTAPAAQFSGERALNHLRVIASEPHTVGSPAQAQVRDYLTREIQAMGLTPQIQDATAALPGESGIFASSLHNILVRIPGGQSSGAVAIMAHYDSQPNTTGASDNGTAVAGILEAMRALQAGPQLRNDLIFILTDAEEVDAQGAEAFFWQHPWAKDIRALINFEAAGNSGASLLLEITPGNRGLLDGFMEGVPHPVAYSFLTQLLNIIPLGTDMTVFAENGVPSLSPMFGWGYHTMYHSRLDNINDLNPRSIQHQGENALGLARAFGSQDLAALNTREDQIFFSLFPGVMVRYSTGWAVPLTVLAALLLACVIVYGFRKRQFSFWGVLGGIASALALILLPLVLAAVAWMIIVKLHPQFWRNLMGAPYRADLYLLGLVTLIAAAGLAMFIILRRKVKLTNLTLGAVLLWLILALLTSFELPGMSYLFTWPAFVTTLILGVMIFRTDASAIEPRSGTTRIQLAALVLGGAANLLLVVPVIVLLFMLIGFWFLMMTPAVPFILVPLLFVALLVSLMAPQMEWLNGSMRLTTSKSPAYRHGWLAPGIASMLALGLLVTASLTSGFSPSQPMQNGVWYTLDADKKEAAWYSFGKQPADPWTAQFFPGQSEPVDLKAVYPMFSDNPVPPAAFKGTAPAANLPVPELTVLSDQTSGDVRTIRLHLTSPRLARGLLVKVSGSMVLAASVNDNRQTNPGWSELKDWYLRFYGMTSQGIDLQLEVRPSTQLTLEVTDQSDGLPELPGVTYSPRTPEMMPFAMAQEYMPYPETTSVRMTYQLP